MIDGPCPACGKHLDHDSGVGHAGMPDPGDVSVCVGCGTVLQYRRNRGGSLRRAIMSSKQIERMPAETRSTLETVLNALGKSKAQPGDGKA